MWKATNEIGNRFEGGNAFIPELLMAARAMKGALDILEPKMAESNTSCLGKQPLISRNVHTLSLSLRIYCISKTIRPVIPDIIFNRNFVHIIHKSFPYQYRIAGFNL